jgi:hypothetical protein
MNSLASFHLTREPAGSRDPAAALTLALEIAAKTESEDHGFLETLALAYHLTGDAPGAVENQKRAIASLPEEKSERRTGMEETLATFEAAVGRADEYRTG